MTNPIPEDKVFIIAELSANHNGSLQTALDTVKAAKRAGADAIKLQTYTAETITLACDLPDFKIAGGTLWDGKYLFDLYQEAYTPWEWHAAIFQAAEEEGLICFSSPFDPSAVDFLETLACPVYKIASFEITDIPLIEYVASKQKPIIISTGIAEKIDIERAVDACLRQGNRDITLLKCTSSYPAPIEEANLKVSLGARVIEKHFILDRSIGGPDAAFSLNEAEFTALVQNVRLAEKALGNASYELTPKQQDGRVFSRSLYPTQAILAGTQITPELIQSVRPGHSLHPMHLKDLMGKTTKRNLRLGERITLDDFE
ncbi:MAG: pseudaminic acid synthase [Flavobacteriia bacterium]|nr:pseudaminic acid synthase [Flavobacteriia bacterium]